TAWSGTTEIFLGGVTLGTPNGASTTWTKSSNLPAAGNLVDGSYTIHSLATDTSSNVQQTPATSTFTLDRVVPAAPATPDLTAATDTGASSTDNITNVTPPAFTGTAEAGSTVTIFDGATQVGSGTAAAYASPGITTSALTQGAHSITAKATDAAGNTSAASS